MIYKPMEIDASMARKESTMQSLKFWTMARHKINGFLGTVLARTEWSNG